MMSRVLETFEREPERDLPGKFSMSCRKAVDDSASGAFQSALLKGRAGGHQGSKEDKYLHFYVSLPKQRSIGEEVRTRKISNSDLSFQRI